jgi:asparagine synthetase B (glutamine-hydrolysing)
MRPSASFETLCGRVPIGGGVPSLYATARSKTWGTVLTGEHCDIAIDGHFVLDGKLVLGRSETERRAVTGELERDLTGFLRRIDNGFFNIVIHDKRQRTTYLANDRFGGLPLYLRRRPESLVFASSYAGLRELCETSLDHDLVGLAELYWFGYQLGERTAFRGVERLPRGTVMSLAWDDGRCASSSYDLGATPVGHFDSPRQASDHLFETMRAATTALYRDDVVYGAKMSAGMDSRFICAAWPDRGLRTYTFGYPGSREVVVAKRLSDALGTRHTCVPLQGDFFSTLHPPIFGRHGIIEWFHQALVPAMQRDGVELVLDGLAGDVVIGGLTLKRSQSRWRQALGLAPDMRDLPSSPEGIAQYLVDLNKVGDGGYRPLTRDALEAVNTQWDEILADMAAEVERASRIAAAPEQVCAEVIFSNRTRRHISLQGTVCRPDVETVYPLLDRRFLALMGRFPPEWVASKRLYVELYSRHYPHIRHVPSTYSLLPFTVAPSWHLAGRVVRYALERLGTTVSFRSAGRFNPWVSDGIQWHRWLAFEPTLQRAVSAYLRPSPVFDETLYEHALATLRRGPSFSGTRFMLTASYCSYFRER